jgi:homoserine kinase type II
MKADVASELRGIVRCYDIGELCHYEQLFLGYCNTSYVIWTLLDGDEKKHFLRKYKGWITEEEIVFEHSVINHLEEKGFHLVARVLRTRDGKTFVQRSEVEDDEQGAFYAVFDFLPGEDRYTWVGPVCSDREVTGAANALAGFHDTIYGFAPAGKRDEPSITELLPIIRMNVERAEGKTKHTVFDAYLLENVRSITESIDRTLGALRTAEFQDMVQLVIHCDYHPGNLKFQDDDIIGLFDFDWCKIDLRCFDVALAIFYFFAEWADERDGVFDLDQTALFLKAYQSTLKSIAGLDPMSGIELECLPHLINAGNLFVLNWTIEDFYAKEVDPEEYLIYLRHGVQVMEWLGDEENRAALRRAIASAKA